MPTLRRIPGTSRILAPGLAVLICAVLAGILVALGQTAAAAGVGLGLLLFLLNTFFLVATLQSLVARDAAHGAPMLAATSSAARLLLLGIALAVIAVVLGSDVFLGAGGGLIAAQISLLLRRSGSEGGA
ncbi:MAG: hypothetical protein NTY63_03490 [Candidatus Bipolaricaulota bacterium]|nr:hypothetical protein [Candidatus Bipolaricaulota bacterium]